MRALFLVSSPGKGHMRCAEAIRTALAFRCGGVEAGFLDINDLIESRVSTAIKDAYLRMTTEQSGLYQRLYDLDRGLYRQLAGEEPAGGDVADFLAEQQRRWFPEFAGRPWFASHSGNLDIMLINTLVTGVRQNRRFPRNRLLLKGVLQLIRRILSGRLMAAVHAFGPDVLIATQMYPNVLVSRAVASGTLKQPVIGVISDYGVHGLWVRPTTRLYCVGHESTARMLADHGVSAERIHVTGIPLRPEFENPPGQRQARHRLGLDDRPTVLVTGGEYGIGTVEAVERLVNGVSCGMRVLVTTDALARKNAGLTALAARHPERVRIFPWTEEMAVLMCAADIVVGKPGGLTVSESLACGRPFIATCALGGQETHNVRFLENHGLGCRLVPEQLPEHLGHLFENTGKLAALQERARAAVPRRAAHAAAELIERCTRHQAFLKVAN